MVRRLAFGFALILLVLLSLVAVDVALLLTPSQRQAWVRRGLEEVLAGPFDFESVELARDGVVLRGLRVGPADRPFLTVPEARILPDWRSLELGVLRVVRPVVRIERAADGSTNLAGLLQPELLERRTGPTRLPRLRVEVESARVEVRDALVLEGRPVVLSDVDARLAVAQAALSLEATIREPWMKRLAIDLTAELDSGELEVEVRGQKIEATRDTIYPILPAPGRRLFDRLRPHGTCDAFVHLRRAVEGAPLEVTGSVSVLHASMSFVRFPYRGENITGRLEVEGRRVRLVGVAGSHNGGRYRCDGEVHIGGEGEGDYVDLFIRADHIAVDEQLARALPEQVERIYRRFDPSGRASADVRVHGWGRPPGIPDEIQWEVEIDVETLAARFDAFPIPVSGLAGRMEVLGEHVVFDGLEGAAAGGSLIVSGSASGDHIALDIAGRGLAVDERVLGTAKAAGADLLDAFQLAGAVDCDLRVSGTRPEGEAEAEHAGGPEATWALAVRPHAALQLTYAGFPYPVTLESGTVRVDPRHGVTLEDLRGRGIAARDVWIDGKLAGEAGGVSLRIAADSVAVDESLIAALEAGTGDGEPALATQLGLQRGGRVVGVELEVEASGITPEERASPRVEGRCELDRLSLRHPALPYPLTQVTGHVAFSPESLRFEKVAAALGSQGTARADGTLDLPGARLPKGVPPGTLRVEVEGLPLDARLREALPDGLRAALTTLDPKGALSLRGFLRHDPEGGLVAWNAETDLALERIDVGLVLDEVDLRAFLHGTWPLAAGAPPRRYLSGAIEIARAKWKGQALEEVAAEIDLGPQSVMVRGLRGGLLRGRILAEEVFYRFEPPHLGGRFRLVGARLEAWASADEGARDGRPQRGRIDGWLNFTGRPGADTARERLHGSGRLTIREGSFGTETLTFDRADLELGLEGERILLSDIDLVGPAMSLSGTGVMVGGEVRASLTQELLPALGRWDKVPLIGWIWRGTRQLLLRLEVEGPLDDLKTRPIPVPIIVDPFRDAIRGERAP